MLIGYAAFSIRLNPIQYTSEWHSVYDRMSFTFIPFLGWVPITTELGSIYDCILRLYYL